MGTIHYRRDADDARAAASMYSVVTASCGAELNGYKVQVGITPITGDSAQVTCKRCLKTLDTGSAIDGILAGASAKARAEFHAARAERLAAR